MSQALMLKKLKLNGAMMTYKTFYDQHQKKRKEKKCPFHHRVLECKSRKSRDSWSNRQVWPWSTKESRAKANRVLLAYDKKHIVTMDWLIPVWYRKE